MAGHKCPHTQGKPNVPAICHHASSRLAKTIYILGKCTVTKTGQSPIIRRVGQNHIYTVHIRYFWQGNHQIYGHIRCIYTVLANPNYMVIYKICLHMVLANPAHRRRPSPPSPPSCPSSLKTSLCLMLTWCRACVASTTTATSASPPSSASPRWQSPS